MSTEAWLAVDHAECLSRARQAEDAAAGLQKIIEDAHRTCDELGVPRRPVRPLNDRIREAADLARRDGQT